MRYELADEAATLNLAGRVASILAPGAVVFLRGELGAGKTAFVRGCLRALGHQGAVKSPTYTLVESYRLGALEVHHFDLYRLADAEELEWMGFRDYLRPEALCFVEWPERGGTYLPTPDLEIAIAPDGTGRTLSLHAVSPLGLGMLQRLQ